MRPESFDIFTSKEIILYRDIYNSVKKTLINDYGLVDFNNYYSNHESPTMKAIAYRFYGKLLETNFFQAAEIALKENRNEDDVTYLRHPIFYARTSYPNSNINDLPLLEGHPHFDRAYLIPAYSLWLALDIVNKETGGLCFFDQTDEIVDLFNVGWGNLNKFSYDTYIKNHKKLDVILKNNILHPNLNEGQAYIFNSYTLHGSTRPLTKRRLSFDFRFVRKNDLLKCAPLSIRLVEAFNNDPLDILSKNMFLIGDYIEAKRLNSKIESLFSNIHVNKVADITVKNQKMNWRLENSFLNK